MTRKFAWKRLWIFGLMVAGSAVFGKLCQPLLSGNDAAIDIIVNLFSILAGFLIAIMTLLGEPGHVARRSWRGESIRRYEVRRRQFRNQSLFLLYMGTLGLVFVSALIGKKFAGHPAITWLEVTYLSFACLAFLLSLRLPGHLMSVQMDRYDELVEARRNGDAESDEDDGRSS